jgi:hypothetical protein
MIRLQFPTLLLGVTAARGHLPAVVSEENELQGRSERYANLDRAVAQTCDHLSRSPVPSFGEELARAVKAKVAASSRIPRPTLRSRRAVFATAANAPADESFEEKIKKAVQKKSGAKRHKEYAERERDRYEEQRKRAMGE